MQTKRERNAWGSRGCEISIVNSSRGRSKSYVGLIQEDNDDNDHQGRKQHKERAAHIENTTKYDQIRSHSKRCELVLTCADTSLINSHVTACVLRSVDET